MLNSAPSTLIPQNEEPDGKLGTTAFTLSRGPVPEEHAGP